MSRTISARLGETESEALDALAKQKSVSRSQLLASIVKQAVDAEAKRDVDNVDIEARQDVDAQAKQAVNRVERPGGETLNDRQLSALIRNLIAEERQGEARADREAVPYDR